MAGDLVFFFVTSGIFLVVFAIASFLVNAWDEWRDK